MPVARGHQFNARSALLVGFTAVMIAIALGVGVIWLAGSGGDVEIQLGDADFDAGQIGRISAEIADRGPILYSDVAGHSRDLILQHLGDDPEFGWLAFDARPDGEPRDCFFEWSSATRQFRLVTTADSIECAPITMDEAGMLSNGEPIRSYPITIDKGDNLRVDINFDTDTEEHNQ